MKFLQPLGNGLKWNYFSIFFPLPSTFLPIFREDKRMFSDEDKRNLLTFERIAKI